MVAILKLGSDNCPYIDHMINIPRRFPFTRGIASLQILLAPSGNDALISNELFQLHLFGE